MRVIDIAYCRDFGRITSVCLLLFQGTITIAYPLTVLGNGTSLFKMVLEGIDTLMVLGFVHYSKRGSGGAGRGGAGCRAGNLLHRIND